MTRLIEIKIPDVGDFKDIPVIELLVQPGDSVNKETPLITLETDKATMEVPAPNAGVVKEIKVKIGDKVSEGSLILILETATESISSQSSTKKNLETKQILSDTVKLTSPHMNSDSIPHGDIHTDVAVLGAGPGGYTAAFRAADLGKNVVLIERYSVLGGVCLNVGCIPSKALLHVAKVVTETEETKKLGVSFGTPKIEINKLREWKESIVEKLTEGLKKLAKQRKLEIIQGTGKFTTPNMILVKTPKGEKTISFEQCIVAAGSSAAHIPGLLSR